MSLLGGRSWEAFYRDADFILALRPGWTYRDLLDLTPERFAFVLRTVAKNQPLVRKVR